MNKPQTSRLGKTSRSRRFVVMVQIQPAPDFPADYHIDQWEEDAADIAEIIHECADIWDRSSADNVATLRKSAPSGGNGP